ncbi:MAG: hypothetical protein OEZ39_07905 [Gammaproteobacteria bacterium]|nr:hypothetical protein [Gammaproteobacteria bacterium]
MKIFYVLFLAVVLLPARMVQAELLMELNGFYLWQMKDGVINHYGQPHDVMENEYKLYHIYYLNMTSHIVFEYLKQDFPHNVSAIQITGYPVEMTPFKGVMLGDSLESVEKKIGKSDMQKPVPGKNKTLHLYNNKNYSLQYDDENKLVSIKIGISKEFMDDIDFKVDASKEFTEAVKNRDIPTVLKLLRPDFEIYKDGKILSVKRRYADFLDKPDQEIIDALVGDKNSVLTALRESEPSRQTRIQDKIGVGEIYKFYSGSIVSRIVFFPYNGKLRVYEIYFCSKGDCHFSKKEIDKAKEL